jgi:hypothetical protein
MPRMDAMNDALPMMFVDARMTWPRFSLAISLSLGALLRTLRTALHSYVTLYLVHLL